MAENGQSAAGGSPGITCPRCGLRFPVSIPQLLAADAISCSHCGLRLSVDQEKSGEALELLRRLEQGITPAQELISPPAPPVGRQRGRSRSRRTE